MLDLSREQLDTLRELAQAGSFVRAAVVLKVTQPGLTQRINQLESAAGVKLFERSRRGVELTSAGIVLLREANAAFQRFEDAAAGLVGVTDVRAVLDIGFTLTSEHEIVPALLAATAAELPSVELVLHRKWTSETSEDVDSGKLDLAFARHPQTWGDLRAELLWEDDLVLAVPRSHRLAGRVLVSLTELAGERLVVVPRELSPGTYDLVDSACRMAGITPILHPVSVLPTIAETPTFAIWTHEHLSLRAAPAPGVDLGELTTVPLRETVKVGLHMVSSHTPTPNPTVEAVKSLVRRLAAVRRGWK
jgi:DNA-binding transcriptional LysR family regulator